MKVKASVPFNAGENAIFGPDVEASLIGQKVDGWEIINAVRVSSSEITLTLEGDIDPKLLGLTTMSFSTVSMDSQELGDIHGAGEG